MKFGKKLQHQLDHTLPEWRSNFLGYKQLKKRLKQRGSTAPMTFLTAAILDGNPSIQDEFLSPVTEDLANVGDLEDELANVGSQEGELTNEGDRDGGGYKRALDDGVLVEERKKRKGLGLVLKENVSENFPEGRMPTVSAGREQVDGSRRSGHTTEKDENFLRLVKTELYKFNAFFLEKEEEFLIRLDILEDRTGHVKEKRLQNGGVGCDRSTYEELIQVHRQIVTLHGEMVLLMNYSSLNYVGLLKILKKYDKQTGANLRQSVHGSVLQQPFFNTSNLKELVERSLACENSLRSIFPSPDVKVVEPVRVSLSADPLENDSSDFEPIPGQTRAALRTIQELRS